MARNRRMLTFESIVNFSHPKNLPLHSPHYDLSKLIQHRFIRPSTQALSPSRFRVLFLGSVSSTSPSSIWVGERGFRVGQALEHRLPMNFQIQEHCRLNLVEVGADGNERPYT